MPTADRITKIVDARFEKGPFPIIVLTVRHSGSDDDWTLPISADAAADMVKRVTALLSNNN